MNLKSATRATTLIIQEWKLSAHEPTYDIWNSIKNYKGAVLCKIHR